VIRGTTYFLGAVHAASRNVGALNADWCDSQQTFGRRSPLPGGYTELVPLQKLPPLPLFSPGRIGTLIDLVYDSLEDILKLLPLAP